MRDHSKKRVVDYESVISIATTVITANQSNHVMGAMLERQGPRAMIHSTLDKLVVMEQDPQWRPLHHVASYELATCADDRVVTF